MQSPDPETRFLAAIARACVAELGADHPLALLAASAHRDQDPAGFARVQEGLAALEEAIRERLLTLAHREMREDIGAIWGMLPGAAQSGGIH